MIELEEEFSRESGKILVAGVGNAGCLIARRVFEKIDGVELLALDTDAESLKKLKIPSAVQIGSRVTGGRGSAENPEAGRKAVLEERERIIRMFGKPEIVFLAAGLGKGVGTGALPPLAEIASASGAVTVVVATVPFVFEGRKRVERAGAALRETETAADSLIVIPNEELASDDGDQTLLTETYDQACGMAAEAVINICGAVMNPGAFSVDFPQLGKLLRRTGRAFLGEGSGEGEGRVARAIQSALASPLAKKADLSTAKTVLMHIKGGSDLTQEEVQKASASLASRAPGADRLIGVSLDRKAAKKAGAWILIAGAETKSVKPASGRAGSVRAPEFPYAPGFPEDDDNLEIPAVIRRNRRRHS